jgi:hypothetical protein
LIKNIPILLIINEDDDFKIKLVESVLVAAEIKKSIYFAQSGKKLKM